MSEPTTGAAAPTDAEIDDAFADHVAPEWRDETPGWHMGLNYRALVRTAVARWGAPHASTPAPAQALTDEQVFDALPGGLLDCLVDPWDEDAGDGDEMRSIRTDVLRVARAVEAAHGIGKPTGAPDGVHTCSPGYHTAIVQSGAEPAPGRDGNHIALLSPDNKEIQRDLQRDEALLRRILTLLVDVEPMTDSCIDYSAVLSGWKANRIAKELTDTIAALRTRLREKT